MIPKENKPLIRSELKVLEMVINGCTSEPISVKLEIAKSTVQAEYVAKNRDCKYAGVGGVGTRFSHLW
jgi:FixJ family two-component response regulator